MALQRFDTAKEIRSTPCPANQGHTAAELESKLHLNIIWFWKCRLVISYLLARAGQTAQIPPHLRIGYRTERLFILKPVSRAAKN